jgi:hypothetical protein
MHVREASRITCVFCGISYCRRHVGTIGVVNVSQLRIRSA